MADTFIAPVETEVGPSGNVRIRCLFCDKVAYDTEERAIRAAEQITERGTPMKHYLGKVPRNRAWENTEYGDIRGKKCGWWHLTRMKTWKGGWKYVRD